MFIMSGGGHPKRPTEKVHGGGGVLGPDKTEVVVKENPKLDSAIEKYNQIEDGYSSAGTIALIIGFVLVNLFMLVT